MAVIYYLLILSMLLFPAANTYAAGNTYTEAGTYAETYTTSDAGEQISLSESSGGEQVLAKQKKDKKLTLTGLKRNHNRSVSPKAVIRDDIQIKPAVACKVRLQYYNKDKAAWETVKVFKVKKSDQGKLRVTYPSTWKQSRKSKWKLVIPAVNGYTAYVSKTVTIISSHPSKAHISLGARGAVIVRASDGYVIYGKNKDKRLPNASTTKMLTALLNMEQGKLNATTKISRRAAETGYGCLDASPGTKFRVKDLLSVLLIHSSNDAAACLAERNAGTIEKFCRKMNRRAKKLGCKNTHFINPHGLHSRSHYSTAYDLTLIQRECMRHQVYMDIVKKKSISFSSMGKNKKHYYFETTDALLGEVKGLLGGKTGHTSGAGHCFCGMYKYNGVVYIFTVLGNESSEGRWRDCRKLMKFIRDKGVPVTSGVASGGSPPLKRKK